MGQRKPLTKIIAAVLILTFSYSELLWAADVRQMILDAKAFFDAEEAKRPGSAMSAQDLQTSQTQQQAAVDQQQMLQDFQNSTFSLTTQNGDVLKYVGDKLSAITRPDGTKLSNVVTDLSGNILNADLRLSDGSIQVYQNGQVLGYQTPDGNQVIYSNGAIQKVVDRNGMETLYSFVKDAQGNVTETTLDNPSFTTKYDANSKIKEATRKSDGQKIIYQNGMIQKSVNVDGSQVLFTSQTVNGDTVVTPQGSATSNIYIDPAGNKFYFTAGSVSKIDLTDGSSLDSILWDANNKIESANLTQPDLQKFVYQAKQLTRSYDTAGIVTNYTYTTTTIAATKAGNTWEYLSDKTPTKWTALDGTVTTFLTTGIYKGLKETETSPTGTKYVYEYTGPASAPTVQKKEIHQAVYNITTVAGQSMLLAANNPYLLLDARFENENLFDPRIDIAATGTGKNLAIKLVPGATGSSYTFNGTTTGLNLTINKGVTYTVEVRWETGRIGVYVYPQGTAKPTTPQGTVADRAWDVTFKAVGQNAFVNSPYDAATYNWAARGSFGTSFSNVAQGYTAIPGTPSAQINFKQTGNYRDISIKIKQSQAPVTRTISLWWVSSANSWSATVSDWNSSTNVTTNTNSSAAQTLTGGVDYTADFRIEGTKLNVYIYQKTNGRPATPTLSFNAFSGSSASFETYMNGATGKGEQYKNQTTPAYVAAAFQAQAITPRMDTVKNLALVKPAAPASGANPTDFSSITYDSLGALKQVILKDGSKLVFDKGILKQAFNAAGAVTSFDFVQSGLSNVIGANIVQSGLTSSYGASGKLSSINIGGVTVHYKADGATVEWIEKADGTELWTPVFDTSGVLTDALIVAPDGEERTYVGGKLTQLRRPDQSQLFYANSQVMKMITPEKSTYNFDYTAPGVVQAILDTTGVPVPDALTPVKMEYDGNFNLKKVTRQNQEVINYLNNQVSQIDAPNAASKIFAYQKDASGIILSYTVTQGNVATNYDTNNQPTSSVISPTADNPNTLTVTYQYGKIRQVKKNGAVTFNYSYSFDAAGTELTQIQDIETNTIKMYQGSDLLSSLDNSNSVLSSYAYQNGKASQVTVSRFGRTLHTYQYSYSGTDTLVADEAGVKRTYDVNQKLTFLEKDGQKFAYTYITQTVTTPNGPPSTQETLLPISLYQTSARSVRSWDGVTAWYSYEQPYGKDYLQTHWAGQWVEYAANTSQAGDLKIALEAADSDSLPSGYTNFQLEFLVDGVSKGTMSVPAGASNSWQPGAITLTGLSQGAHTVRLKFVNFISNSTGQTDFKFRNISFKQQVTTVTTTTRQEEITTENLIERRLQDGSLAHYANGKVSQIDYADGRVLKNLVTDAGGNVAEATLFANAQDAVGTKIGFEAGQIKQVTLADGKTLSYSYDKDSNGNILNTWVKKGPAILKYDASNNLVGVKIDGVMEPGQVQAAAIHSYQGGVGANSIDGDFNTYQGVTAGCSGCGGIGATATSEHSFSFTQSQMIKDIIFKMSVSAYAHGNYIRDYNARYSVEVLRNGTWQTVTGSAFSCSGGDGACSKDSGIVSLSGVNLDNVTALRAYANGFGNASGGEGSSGGSANIYEVQFVLADQANLAFIKNPPFGTPSMYVLSGLKGTLTFFSSGALMIGNSNYLSIQQELTGNIQNYVTAPYKSSDFSTLISTLADTETIVSQEYSSDGTLETQTKTDGTVTLFDNNKPSKVLDSTGRTLIQYSYDAAGNPTRVYLKNARDTLPGEVLKAKQNIEAQRDQTLHDLAAQKNLAYQSVQTQFQAQKQSLESSLSQLQGQFDQVANTSAKGKSAKSARGDALNAIGAQMDQVRGALASLYGQEADAYAALDAQILTVSNQIEADAANAVTNLGVQEATMKKEILRQEVSPIVYDYYRRLLGRDPDTNEYNYWIGQIDYNSGTSLAEAKTTGGTNITTALNTFITALPELAQRQAYVNAIKSSVTAEVNGFVAMTQTQKDAYAAALGLAPADVIALSSADATKILSWINTRSLHFGQSAFLALESLLDQKGKIYTRETLARQAILIDVLTGVISPLDDGDLVLSVFALNKTAKLYGVDLVGANVSWDDIKAIVPAASTATSPRLIAHINGNHFVIVTAITDTTITYIDPGKGKDKQNEVLTVSKTNFLKVWKGNAALNLADYNAIKTVRGAATQAKTLSAMEAKNIRGAFLPLLFIAIAGAISSVGSAVFAVVNGIGAILSAVGTVVANALSGIGFALSKIGQGLSYIGQGLFESIKFAASTIGQVFGNPFASFSSQNLIGGAEKQAFGDVLFQNAVKVGFSVATQKGLQALGVNPIIAGLTSAFVTGGITGGFNAGFTAQNFIQSGMKAFALQGGQTVLQNAGIDTTLSQTLLTVAAPFIDGIQTGSIGGAAVKIVQDLPKNLSNYSLAKVGESLGLSPGIAFAAAMPLAQTLSDGLKTGNLTGQNLIQSVQNSITQGAVTYGIDFAGQSSPILGSLLSQDIVKNIELAIGRDGLFGTVFNILRKTVLNVVNVVGGTVQSVFQGISSFAGEIQQKGLAGALELNRDALFNRTTQEAILAKGGVQNVLNTTTKTPITLQNGQSAQELKISNAASLYFDNAGNLIGKKEDGVTQIGTYYKDSTTGNVALQAGVVYADVQTDLHMTTTVNDGQATSIRIDGPSQPLVTINPEQPNTPIKIEGPKNDQEAPSFWMSVLSVAALGVSLMFEDGKAKNTNVTINPVSLSPVNQLTDIALLNGVRLIEQFKTWVLDGVTPAYFEPGSPYRNKLNNLGENDSLIKTIPLFESLTDLFYLLDNFYHLVKTNEMVVEIKNYFLQIAENQPGRSFVPLAYSGAGTLTLSALSDKAQNGYNVKTAILVGAPLLQTETTIYSPSLERIVNVYGVNDPFVATAVDSNVPGVRKMFTKASGNFETINIELVGIDHIEYFYENDDNPTPEQRKASDFMAHLTQAALDPQTLERFLRDFAGNPTIVTPVYLNGFEQKNRTYIVDIKSVLGL